MSRPRDFRLNDGTVIDHLPVGHRRARARAARLPREGPITVGINVPSPEPRAQGHRARRGALPRARRELDRLALLGPHITVSIVRDGRRRREDGARDVPERLIGILTCRNPTCITNDEDVPDGLPPQRGEFPYRFQCDYCDGALHRGVSRRRRWPGAPVSVGSDQSPMRALERAVDRAAPARRRPSAPRPLAG